MRRNKRKAIERAKHFRKKRKAEYFSILGYVVLGGAGVASMVASSMLLLSLFGF